MYSNERNNIHKRLRAEICGPSTGQWDKNAIAVRGLGLRQADLGSQARFAPMFDAESGEELLPGFRTPKSLYGVGVLFPADDAGEATGIVELGGSDDLPDTQETLPQRAGVSCEETNSVFVAEDEVSPEKGRDEEGVAERPGYRRRFVRSSTGVSFAARLQDGDRIVAALPSIMRFPWQHPEDLPWKCNGIYRRVEVASLDGGESQTRYLRSGVGLDGKGISVEFEVQVPARGQVVRRREISEVNGLRLRFDLTMRGSDDQRCLLCTVTATNISLASVGNEVGQLLFQALLTVSVQGAQAAFVSYSQFSHYGSEHDDDDLSLGLLYSDVDVWAIGHGAAGGWNDREPGGPLMIWADPMPAVELPSMTADIKDSLGQSLAIKMLAFADESVEWGLRAEVLSRLVERYGEWIETQREKVRHLECGELLQARAVAHLAECERAKERMRLGLQILAENRQAREAFRLASVAMALQQVAQRDLGRPGQDERFVGPSDLVESLTNKSWRPFQIGFLLSSVASICTEEADDEDRKTVDLIWFPTGGGKTEAYLGLIAFTVFWNRMRYGKKAFGTNAFMRYTLRMLTTQQFQRGASLVAAMEWLRQQQGTGSLLAPKGGTEFALGDHAFSLGLWVGSAATPNEHKEAAKQLRDWIKSGVADESPFPIVECPWCRRSLGLEQVPSGSRSSTRSWRGHSEHIARGFKIEQGKLVVHCPSRDCPLHETIPVHFVDEQIYDEPPSFLIGTVDKFVQLAFQSKARSLFGFRSASAGHVMPPCLIVQDELHLITGPLGSLFGVFECVVEELCAAAGGLRPKIVCSTATTRGATRQVMRLFGRERLQVFPPPGVAMGDSFFGQYARDEQGRLLPGRLHVGVMACNYPSQQIANTRVFGTLLLSAAADVEDSRRDPWWTVLAYFKSIRELSGAAVLCQFDVPEYLQNINARWGLSESQRRRRCSPLELSGRLDAPLVIDRMQKLSSPYGFGRQAPPDICLATNIIEVGVDIPRLSVLVMDGPPSSAARYIQVAGRVGRNWSEAPGFVVTMYSAGKPRDLSHFEHFWGDHLRLYASVEPNSVTPFSGEAIDRHLHTAMVAWIRARLDPSAAGFSNQVDACAGELIEKITMRIRRAEGVGSEEARRAIGEVVRRAKEFTARWRANPEMERWVVRSAGPQLGLLLPAGRTFTYQQRVAGTQTMETLRSVDGVAVVRVLPEGEAE